MCLHVYGTIMSRRSESLCSIGPPRTYASHRPVAGVVVCDRNQLPIPSQDLMPDANWYDRT